MTNVPWGTPGRGARTKPPSPPISQLYVTTTPLISKRGKTRIVRVVVRVAVDRSWIQLWTTKDQVVICGPRRTSMTTTSPLLPIIAQVYPTPTRVIMVHLNGTRTGGPSVHRHRLHCLAHKANLTQSPNHQLGRQWTIMVLSPGISTRARDLKAAVMRLQDGIRIHRVPDGPVVICRFLVRWLRVLGYIHHDLKRSSSRTTPAENHGENHMSVHLL